MEETPLRSTRGGKTGVWLVPKKWSALLWGRFAKIMNLMQSDSDADASTQLYLKLNIRWKQDFDQNGGNVDAVFRP